MALSADDIGIAVDEIVSGTEEALVSRITDTLVDDLVSGVLDGGTWSDLETLSRANAVRLRNALMELQGKVDGDIHDAVTSALASSDLSDIGLFVGMGLASSASAAMDPVFQSMSAQAVRGITEIVTRQNIALTSMAERAWYRQMAETITAVEQGLMERGKAIAKAVENLSEVGVTTIDYASGVSTSVDAATRRHITTQLSQAGGDLTLQRCAEFGWDLVSVDTHYGERDSHARWAGKAYATGRKQVKRDGKTYRTLFAACGYKNRNWPLGDRLKGVNCRHIIAPYFPGVTTIKDNKAELEKAYGMSSQEYYAATQKQRAMETRIRSTKRECGSLERGIAKAKKSGASPDDIAEMDRALTNSRLRLGGQQEKLKDFCGENKLTRDYRREKAYGIGAQLRGLKKQPMTKPPTSAKWMGASEQMSWYKKAGVTKQERDILYGTAPDSYGVGYIQNSDYSTLQGMLRQYGNDWENQITSPIYRRLIDTMDDTISRVKLGKDTSFVRYVDSGGFQNVIGLGTNDIKQMTSKQLNNQLARRKITDFGYTSTSVDPARNYFADKYDIRFDITAKKGTTVLFTDNIPESEAIFSREVPAYITGAHKVAPTGKGTDKRVILVLDVLIG